MPHPPEYYKNLRNNYTPEKINIIFLLESPPESGLYFYDTTGLITEPLFAEMMRFLEIQAENKEQGLTEFCKRGYLLVDATYTPVNKIKNRSQRDRIILNDHANLTEDLKNLKSLVNKTPIVLIKANIYDLYIERLALQGFNIINGKVKIPYPDWRHIDRFHITLKELISLQ